MDSVHEQREKRIILLSGLSNHRGEVETRVPLFKMASTTNIANDLMIKRITNSVRKHHVKTSVN